jgi:hypothetical protein
LNPFPAITIGQFSGKGGWTKENEDTGAIFLDEGVEESTEDTMGCCTTAKGRIYEY